MLTPFHRIRPIYVFEKVTAFFGSFALLYTITETFILPKIPTADQSFLLSLLDLAMPFMFGYLMIFYIIFGKWHWLSHRHRRLTPPRRVHLQRVR